MILTRVESNDERRIPGLRAHGDDALRSVAQSYLLSSSWADALWHGFGIMSVQALKRGANER